MLSRSTAPLIYHGRICRRHRCADRLVETHECLECVGPVRLRQMEERTAQQAVQRRVHRVLHEMSDGGKTELQLVHTTGLSMAQLRPLLEQLAAAGRIAYVQERLGHHSRWIWSLTPPRRRSSSPRP